MILARTTASRSCCGRGRCKYKTASAVRSIGRGGLQSSVCGMAPCDSLGLRTLLIVVIFAPPLAIFTRRELDPRYFAPDKKLFLSLIIDPDTLLAVLPFFEKSQILRYFGAKAQAQSGKMRVRTLGLRRLCMKSISSFALHPAKVVGDKMVCWVTCMVPASMKHGEARKAQEAGEEVVPEVARRVMYEVMLALEVADSTVIEVLSAKCGCKSGKLCVHISAVCQAHHYLKDDQRLLTVKDGKVCTSQLCRWLEPKRAPAVELSRMPLKRLVMYAADPDNIFKHSNLPCHGSLPVSRSACIDPSKKRKYFDPRRVQCRSQLWDSAYEANCLRARKKLRKDAPLPRNCMMCPFQSNWGTEEAQEQRRAQESME